MFNLSAAVVLIGIACFLVSIGLMAFLFAKTACIIKRLQREEYEEEF